MKSILLEQKKIIIHHIKERILLYKYYDFSFLSKERKQLLVSVFDDRRNSFGLADRFKGIVSLYAYSKVKNIDFRCHFVFPFDFSKFFIPNAYNWLLKENELSNSISNARVLILHGENGKRLINLKSKKQIHAYINRDYLPIINQKFGTDLKWGNLFNELFRPTPQLQAQINHNLNKIGQQYIGCVFRFQSLLGDFKEYNFETLSDDSCKQDLINKCIIALIELKDKTTTPILVTSDSSTFLNAISEIDRIFTIEGKVVHLGYSYNESESVYMKSFVDFMMLTNADKIYSIGTSQMYPTEFPLYAAKVNNIPFERILI